MAKEARRVIPDGLFNMIKSGLNSKTVNSIVTCCCQPLHLLLSADALKSEQAFSFSDASRSILAEDFLAPVVGTLVYPDLLQRILLMPVYPFDRARALEESWEEAWNDERPESHFSAGYLSLWSNNTYKVPAFFLNTTRVENGNRAIVSNIKIGKEFRAAYDLGEKLQAEDRGQIFILDKSTKR
jgi:hypothetical protein